jgi:hypothetical protein
MGVVRFCRQDIVGKLQRFHLGLKAKDLDVKTTFPKPLTLEGWTDFNWRTGQILKKDKRNFVLLKLSFSKAYEV